jgi:ADP-ribose pyrophosphatase YjhB (NUDIX family)
VTLEEAQALPPWTRVAAYALCVDDADRLLLARVAPGYMAAGQWTLPGGGLGFGEDPADAVLRELAEETGLIGTVISLAFVQSLTNGPLVEAGKAYGPWHGIGIVYRVAITGGDLRDEVDESTDACAWLTRDEITSLPRTEFVDAALGYLDANL